MAFSANAQTEDSLKEELYSSYFSVKTGALLNHPSIRNTKNEYNPLIQNGLSYGVEGNWLFSSYLGLSAQFTAIKATQADAPFDRFPGKKVFSSEADWSTNSAGLGLIASIPLRDVHFEIKSQAVWTKTNAWQREVYFTQNNTNYFESLAYKGTNYGVNLGVSLRLNLKPGLNVMLYYDHLVMFAKWKNDLYFVTPANFSSSSFTDQKLQFHQIGLGFLYSIAHYR
jgi:hypothetical protein